MGFKRTAEGRIFFQGANTNEAPEPNEDLSAFDDAEFGDIEEIEGTARNEEVQSEIIGLLKTLNDKLKATQAERDEIREELNHHREKMMALEERAESDHEEFEEKVRSFETITKRQATLEKLQLEQQQKLANHSAYAVKIARRLDDTQEKQDILNNRMEESLQAQARLVRQIDKAVQDRSRMLRKMDRIEETVLQTRDALNAKAMVLLTDEGAAQSAGVHANEPLSAVRSPDPKQLSQKQETEKPPRWWQKLSARKLIGLSGILLGGVLAGWLISDMQMPKMPGFDQTTLNSVSLSENDWQAPPKEPQQLTEPSEGALEPPAFTTPEGEEAVDESVAEGVPDTIADDEVLAKNGQEQNVVPLAPVETLQEPAAVEKSPDASLANDIGAIDLEDEDSLLKALEKNPDGLAAKLNDIEVSSIPADNEVKSSEEKKAGLANAGEKKTAPEEIEKIRKALLAQMPQDSSLPDIIKDIEKQAYDGNPEAQHDLAAIYTAGHGGVTQDYKRAAFWFEQAANAGVANARYNLGVLYHQGIGVPRDIEKALYWYRQAADLNHPEAQYNLGIAYIEGIGLEYDPQKAAWYFENAAEAGVMEAAYNLGLIYENGLLGQAKPDEALMWYKQAADEGSPEAKAALRQLASSLNIKIEDVNRLVDEVKRSRESGRNADDMELAPQVKQATAQSAEAAVQNARRRLTAQVQQQLMDAGLYPGPADGLNGPLTQDAVRAYQMENDLEATGDITQELLAHMRGRLGAGSSDEGSRAQ